MREEVLVLMDKNKELQRQIIVMSGCSPEKCMKCGKCSGSCPAYDEMEYHPHQFVSMINRGEIEPLMRSASVYKCLSCFACAERCPRDVEPARLIEAVRVCALRQKEGNRITPADIPALVDDAVPQQALTSAMRKYMR